MNILITGASGFIGRKLLEAISNNAQYKSNKIILLTSKEISGYTSIIHHNYSFTKEDFYNKGINNIDILIHLGAFIPKSSLDANNIEASISNITNTEYLLKNLPSIPKKIIFLSTIDVYGTVSGIISEETSAIPNTLYGHSKLFSEKIILEWSENNKVTPQVLRIGHIYGEGEDEYKKILPVTINKIIKNEHPEIYSDGKEKRTFLYIDDCCKLILKSIELDEYNGPINITGSKEVSILELINLVIEVSGKNIIPIIKNKNIGTRDLIFDTNKMVKYLGVGSTDLKEGIIKEYEYFYNK